MPVFFYRLIKSPPREIAARRGKKVGIVFYGGMCAEEGKPLARARRRAR